MLTPTFMIAILATTLVGSMAGDPTGFRLVEFSNGDLIISTDDENPSNYVIISPRFDKEWKSVSVNGNYLQIIDKDCNSLHTTMDSLNDVERILIKARRMGFDHVLAHIDEMKIGENGLARILHTSNDVTTGGSLIGYIISRNDLDGVTLLDKVTGDFIISRKNFPSHLLRVVVRAGLVVTTSKDGIFQMICDSSLTADQREIMGFIKSEVYKRLRLREKRFSESR